MCPASYCVYTHTVDPHEIKQILFFIWLFFPIGPSERLRDRRRTQSLFPFKWNNHSQCQQKGDKLEKRDARVSPALETLRRERELNEMKRAFHFGCTSSSSSSSSSFPTLVGITLMTKDMGCRVVQRSQRIMQIKRTLSIHADLNLCLSLSLFVLLFLPT